MALSNALPVFRHRETDDRTLHEEEVTVYRSSGLTEYQTYSEMVGVSSYMDDYEVPSFHARKAAGQLFFNPCTKVVTDYSVMPAVGSIVGPTVTLTGAWVAFDVWDGDFLPIPDFEDEAALSANAAFAKVTSAELLSLVTIAEIKETKEMLLNVIRRAGKLRVTLDKWRRAVAKSKFKASGAAVDSAADLWLEIRYGWTPLYHEIKAIANVLDGLEEKAARQTFRSFSPLSYTTSSSNTYVNGNDGMEWTKSLTCTGHVSSGVLCEPRVNGRPDVLGITKIPETLWELTRLSFAIDWLFNVGDIIASWTPDTYWRTSGSWTTRKFTSTSRASGLYKRFDTWTSTLTPYVRTEQRTSYFRSQGAERAISPMVAFRMNWRHYIDAVALGRKQFKTALAKCFRAKPSRRHYHVTT
jgi:hypothetical protein